MSDAIQQIEKQSLDSHNITPLNLNKQDLTSSFPHPNDKEESKTPSAISQQYDAPHSQQKTDQEVSKESLLMTLKTLSAELKKMEVFKKKLEDRFEEKVKQAKDLQKEKSIMADFIIYVIPTIKIPNVFDKEEKLLMDLDTLIKTHAELQAAQLQELSQMNNMSSGKLQQNQQQKSNSDELLPLFKEENENLKLKIIDLTTMYKQEQQKVQSLQATAVFGKLKDDEKKKIQGLEDHIREKEDQLCCLRQISKEFTEMKGKQLLQVIKATNSNDCSQTLTTEVEEIQTLKQQLSDKTNKIFELNQNLQLANQTIQAIEESNNLKQNQLMSDQLIADSSLKMAIVKRGRVRLT